MDQLTFLHLERIHLLWVVVVIVVALVVLELRSQDRLGHFLSRVMQNRLASRQSLERHIVRLVLVLAACIFGIVALMRPQTPGTTETLMMRQTSADVMVVLDVSRSMLAEDTTPNRLERAKAEINDLLAQVDDTRVGLVVFAGRASMVCPLTFDHGFFRMALRNVNANSAARGGTRLGDAIEQALDTFQPGERARLILLVTDGEDHDSFPLEQADEARSRGIPIVTIGFGSEEGSEIVITDPDTGAREMVLDDFDNVVISRLDGELLQEIALRTEGVYIPAGVAALDLSSIVRAHIEPLARVTAAESSVRIIPGEQFHWFVLGSLISLVGAVWISSTGQKRGLS